MRNYDKILMTGAQGTGKTTLLKAWQNERNLITGSFIRMLSERWLKKKG